jgi:amidohydrolase
MLDAKAGAWEQVNATREKLVDLSHRIHRYPELGFEEEKASAWVAESLAEAGFTVERGVCDLPTALVARKGSGPLHIGFCAEYDCLPMIGHACGHNLIAAMSVGAAIAAAKVADEVGLTVSLLGTPAEEVGDGGGKILMIERGGFAGIHAAMMAHPYPINVAELSLIALAQFDISYTGKESHASAFPERGINAADALTVAQTAIGLLRQHIRNSDRIHGIVTKGGDAPNVIPAHTTARYMVRAKTLKELERLVPRVHRCFEAGAIATGSSLEISGGMRPFAEVIHHAGLSRLYRRNAEVLGQQFHDGETVAATTDMGNVSQLIPAIHPMIGIGSMPAVNHQAEFATACITALADQAIVDGALALSWTAIDAATDVALRAQLLALDDAPP